MANVYEIVTDKVIEMLESGTAPWRKPWASTDAGLPRSMSTGKPYRGVNPFLLNMSAMAGSYGSPWWGTYRQIAERGGQVRKGEKSTLVVFWKFLDVVRPDADTGEPRSDRVPMLRYFSVFNAEQSDAGLRLPSLPETVDREPLEDCEGIVRGYLSTGPSFTTGGDRAYYSPAADRVVVPTIGDHRSAEAYYSTLFHELTHSTGHRDRLARQGVIEGHKFGDALYSKEELIAEMGAAMLCGIAGIENVTLANSAAYLASWLRVLRGDTRMVVTAAASAQKAADLIRGLVAVETGSEEMAA